jgi:biopolymer transport protein ExbD
LSGEGTPVAAVGRILALAMALMIPACSPTRHPDVVTLEVLGDGTFVWNGQHVPDAEALDRFWKAAAAQDPQPEIHLKPNRDAKYDAVADALSGAQRNGVYKFGFIGNVAPSPPDK